MRGRKRIIGWLSATALVAGLATSANAAPRAGSATTRLHAPVARQPIRTEDAYARGLRLLHEGDRQGALAALEKALTTRGEDAHLWQLVGDLHFTLDEAPEAVRCWVKGLELAADSDALLQRVAHGATRVGDFTLAAQAESRLVDVLSSRLDNAPDARRLELTTGKVVGLGESLKLHLGLLSELAVLAGDFTTGEQAARRLIKLEPNGIEGRLSLAYVHLQGAEYDEAESLYREILAVRPDNTTALNNLGNIFYMRRDLDGAAEFFESILESPNASKYAESIALANLGELMQLQSAYKDSRDLYQQAISTRPDGAWGYMGLASLLDVMGRHDEATETMIDGWERDQNQLTRLNMHYFQPEWAWQRDALIAEIEGDQPQAELLWNRVANGDVRALQKTALWHLQAIRESASN